MSVSGFSEEEVLALKEFRQRVADVLPDDEFSKRNDYLIRWIRAREMDLDKAEEMMRNSMKWRTENKIDSILSAGMDPDLCERFPYFLDGIDKFGRPVLTMKFGSWDVRTFVENEGAPPFVRYLNQMLENLVAAVKRQTFEVEKLNVSNQPEQKDSVCMQFVVISNMEGYSYRQLANMKAVQTLIQMVSVYEAHYPETMAACIVINAPTIFSILFGLLKPFMSGRTLDKIKIFNSDKSQWQPHVLQIVDASQLREAFGGTKQNFH